MKEKIIWKGVTHQMKTLKEYTEDELVFSLPLYRKVEIDWSNMKEKTIEQVDREQGSIYKYNEYVTSVNDEFQKLIDFINGKANIHIYGTCPHCKKGMSFEIGYGIELKLTSNKVCSYTDMQLEAECYIPDAVDEMRKIVEDVSNRAKYFERKFRCPLCRNIYQVSYRLLFEGDKLYLMKVGQYPSLHEFSEYSSKAYDKLLKKMNARDDYRNAIKMNIDGYNIAAYVYLRRVVEKIILYVYNENNCEVDCEYEKFKKLHMDEKIQTLKGFLPQFLSENKQIYSVVSAGIHMLDEETCTQYFDILHTSIEIILNEYEANRKKKLLVEKTSNAIKNAHDAIAKELNSN